MRVTLILILAMPQKMPSKPPHGLQTLIFASRSRQEISYSAWLGHVSPGFARLWQIISSDHDGVTGENTYILSCPSMPSQNTRETVRYSVVFLTPPRGFFPALPTKCTRNCQIFRGFSDTAAGGSVSVFPRNTQESVRFRWSF